MNHELLKAFENEENALDYLIGAKVVNELSNCPHCRCVIRLDRVKRLYRCQKKTCNRKWFPFACREFRFLKIPLNKLLQISYLYLIKTPVSGIINFTGCSSRTITSWCNRLRNILGRSLYISQRKIGGPGIVVEVDETKLGKRKYNRGHRVDGVWCICGIERTPEKRCFVVSVEDRSSDTIKNVLSNHINQGSIIYTDCWRAYKKPCEELFFQHLTVNHSKEFVDKVTGVHTNTVEGLNNALKTEIKPRNRNKEGIDDYLNFFLWKRINKTRIWDTFILALKDYINK